MANVRGNKYATKKTAGAVGDVVGTTAESSQRVSVAGLEGARLLGEQLTRAFGLSSQNTEALTRQASENFGAVTETTTVLARGVQEASREWLSFVQERIQKNVEALTRLSQCQSVQDYVGVQGEILRENWQHAIEANRRVAEHSLKVASEATEKIAAQVKRRAA